MNSGSLGRDFELRGRQLSLRRRGRLSRSKKSSSRDTDLVGLCVAGREQLCHLVPAERTERDHPEHRDPVPLLQRRPAHGRLDLGPPVGHDYESAGTNEPVGDGHQRVP